MLSGYFFLSIAHALLLQPATIFLVQNLVWEVPSEKIRKKLILLIYVGTDKVKAKRNVVEKDLDQV